MTVAEDVARHERTILDAEQELAYAEYESAERDAVQARLVELHAQAPLPLGVATVCDHMWRDSEGEVQVCGTYANRYEDGSTFCQAGHAVNPVVTYGYTCGQCGGEVRLDREGIGASEVDNRCPSCNPR